MGSSNGERAEMGKGRHNPLSQWSVPRCRLTPNEIFGDCNWTFGTNI